MSKSYKIIWIMIAMLFIMCIYCTIVSVPTKYLEYPQFEFAKGYIAEDLDDKYDVHTIYGYKKTYLAEDKYIVRVYFQTSQSTIEREYIVIIKDEIKIYLVDFRD